MSNLKIILISATFIWCGMLLGISFMEAPLKFQAPGITLKLGLGIGELVFTMLNRVEIILAILIAVALFKLKPPMKLKIFFLIPISILLIQSVYLLPVLNARIDLIQSGTQPEPSSHHIIYIIFEIIKLTGLIFGGMIFLKKEFENNL